MKKMKIRIDEKDEIDYFKYSKEELKEMGEDGRRVLRMLIERESMINNLKGDMNVLSSIIYDINDLWENENDMIEIKYMYNSLCRVMSRMIKENNKK